MRSRSMRRSRSERAVRSAVSRTDVYWATLRAIGEAPESALVVSGRAPPASPGPQATTPPPRAAIAAHRVKNDIRAPMKGRPTSGEINAAGDHDVRWQPVDHQRGSGFEGVAP